MSQAAVVKSPYLHQHNPITFEAVSSPWGPGRGNQMLNIPPATQPGVPLARLSFDIVVPPPISPPKQLTSPPFKTTPSQLTPYSPPKQLTPLLSKKPLHNPPNRQHLPIPPSSSSGASLSPLHIPPPVCLSFLVRRRIGG